MEQRLHIVIQLPNDHPQEAIAYHSALSYISEEIFPGEGYSLFKRVEGYWLSDEFSDQQEWVRDYSTLYVTDVPLPNTPQAEKASAHRLYALRLFVLAAYMAVGRPQDEIWVTSHPITRHGGNAIGAGFNVTLTPTPKLE